MSLAAADFSVALFVLLPSMAKMSSHLTWSSGVPTWPYGVTACKIWVTMDVAFCTISIYNLIGISVDRFYAVYYPIK